MATTSSPSVPSSRSAGEQDSTPIWTSRDGERIASPELAINGSLSDAEDQEAMPVEASIDVEKAPDVDPNIVD